MQPTMKTVEIIDNIRTGEDFRAERVRLRIPLREVAEEVGISFQYLAELERGNRRWKTKYIDGYNRVFSAKNGQKTA